MSERKCAVCSNPVHNQDTICSKCVAETRKYLANQAAYLADLATEMARQSVKQPPSEGGRSAEIPLPYNPQAGELITEQHALLASWARLCHDERIIPDMPADTIPSLASWLIVALPVLRRHEAAGEFRAEVRALAARIVKCIDLPEYRQKTILGNFCPEVYTDEHGTKENCPGEIELCVPHDRDLPGWVRCRGCQVEWPPTQWMRAGRRILQRMEELRQQRELAASFTRQRVA